MQKIEEKIDFSYQSQISLQIINKEQEYKVSQIQTSCLAQNSYIIENGKECVIIDPMREGQPYIDYIKKNGLNLKYIMMTHVHADFVSGHLELQKEYQRQEGKQCQIVYGPKNKVEYEIVSGEDEQLFQLQDNLYIKLMHTPGHTMESSCYLLNNQILFSGDTLFLGEVGRPDLAANVLNLTKEQMASYLYNSIQKLKKLDKDTIILTGHGSGSPCGKKIQSGTHSYMKSQLQTNYALQDDLNEQEFIKILCSNIPKPQNWFSSDVMFNLKGYTLMQDSIKNIDFNVNINQAIKMVSQDENIKLLDCRSKQQVLEKGYIPQSKGIYADTSIAQFLGQLFDQKNQFIIIASQEKHQEIIIRFNRIGYNNIIGFVNNYEDYQGTLQKFKNINSNEMVELIQNDQNIKLLDVRKQVEYDQGNVKNSCNYQLDWITQKQDIKEFINDNYKDVDEVYVHCQGGMRSLLAIHLLSGLNLNKQFINIKDGFIGLKNNNVKIQ